MSEHRIELTESQRSLIQICLEIARQRFTENAQSIALPRAADQFARQAQEAAELSYAFSQAGEIVLYENSPAAASRAHRNHLLTVQSLITGNSATYSANLPKDATEIEITVGNTCGANNARRS